MTHPNPNRTLGVEKIVVPLRLIQVCHWQAQVRTVLYKKKHDIQSVYQSMIYGWRNNKKHQIFCNQLIILGVFELGYKMSLFLLKRCIKQMGANICWEEFHLIHDPKNKTASKTDEMRPEALSRSVNWTKRMFPNNLSATETFSEQCPEKENVSDQSATNISIRQLFVCFLN